MLPLIFFTTNRVKLAHVKYLAEQFSLNREFKLKIEGFKQKTYHANYNEPRIKSRKKLLQLSYESALEQAKKAGIDTTKKFFFLEDTSVVIDALSNSKKKIPDVDVKYWMKKRSFNSLDALLKKHGDNRKAIVRSDILLHIPEAYRQKCGLDQPYIVLTGYQEGSITEEEHSFETDTVFPWLDNKSFNKWFVPTGEKQPISLLPINQANKYDFRKHAFTKMADFLLEKRVVPKDYKQQSLNLDIPPVLIVCGYTCAGKTTISQYLIRKYGYRHIEASDYMYLNYYLRHDVNSKIDIGAFAEKALNAKPEVVAENIAEYMQEFNTFPTVISGFRSIKEIEWITNYFENNKKFQAIFIQANRNIRHKRFNKRKRNGAKLSLDGFRKRDKQQERMGLKKIATALACKTIRNEGSLDDLYSAFKEKALLTTKFLNETEIDFSKFQNFSQPLRLEDSIFVALLSKWDDSEDREYFTTTEIARIIGILFPALKPKHKDNVSRYFNQDFSAFYEIKPSDNEAKRRYRLSNTGYGKAVQVYFRLTKGNPSSEPSSNIAPSSMRLF